MMKFEKKQRKYIRKPLLIVKEGSDSRIRKTKNKSLKI